jgi:spermidine synthase
MPQQSILLLIFFFFSGAAALSYEIVWIRQLSLTLSVTVYALTTVLCAFMAGLAIGSAISARIADRIRRPMWGFGLIEIGIGLSGMATPFVLAQALPPAFIAIHEAFGGEGVFFSGSRFLLAFLVLLLPTTLMGITLPLLSRAVIGSEGSVGLGAGALYAANTLGAVTGCVLAGFVLIPEFGMLGTSALAATVNVTIGVLALAAGRRQAASPPLPVAQTESSFGPTGASGIVVLVTVAYAISGFTAMGYEILWTRALEHYTHNSTYAYTAILATFLLGLGAGSALIARFADRFERPVLAIGVVQLLVALSVLGSLIVYQRFETLVPAFGGVTSFERAVAIIFAEAGLALFVTTVLLGAMFPLVTRVAVETLQTMGRRIGIVYFLNTIGSILGSLLVGFLVLPTLGMRGAFLALMGTNLALAAVLALRGRRDRPAMAVAGGAVATAVLAGTLLPADFFEAQFRERFDSVLFFKEEVTDTVMVTEDSNGLRMIRFSDGRGTAGTGTVMGDRMYGHVPLLLHPEPRRVLQIAFGVGNSLSSVLQHPSVEHVDCVELSPGVIEAAEYFEQTNRRSLHDPRVALHITDGRNYLLTSKDRYDVIRLDPPELHTRGVVNLYTREFYELARDHLAPGGVFSIWVNIAMTPEEDMQHLVRTVLEVFPHVTVWHDPGKFSWIVNGSMVPRPPDLEVLRARWQIDSVRDDLASIGAKDPYEFLTYFMFDEAGAKRFAGPGPLVVDDKTILDFSVPRSQDSFFGMSNLNSAYFYFTIEKKLDPKMFGGFLRKIVQMGRHQEDVAPAVVGARTLAPDELEREIEAARERLIQRSLPQGARQSPSS